jgi:hypothetical protein
VHINRCRVRAVEVKGHPRTGHEGPEGEWRYSSTLSLTLALDGVGGQLHVSAALPPPPGMTRYPFYKRLGRPQGQSGRVLKISPAPGFDPRTVQLVASRYTDYVYWCSRLLLTAPDVIFFSCW